MALDTLYSITQRNESDAYIGLIEDQTQYSPTFYELPATARAGITYKTLSRTALPSSGFRQANTGVTGSSSTWKQELHEMYYLYTPIYVDEMIYSGDDGVTGDLLYQEAQGGLQSSLNTIENQTWYGAAFDGSNGFVGLRQQLLASAATNPGNTPVSASALNNTSTVFGLWTAPQGVSYAVGKSGQISFPSFQKTVISVANGSNTGLSNTPINEGYFTSIKAWIGLSVGSNQAVFGVTGCQGIGGNTFTDKLAQQLIATVPLTRRNPFLWFMNRTVYAGLQSSRTAINYANSYALQPAGANSGLPAVSPPPLMVEGYRIVVTDGLLNTENNA